MSGWVETSRNVVYPWHCDHLGHMNVKNYVGFFDVSAFHFLSLLGFSSHNMHELGATFVDAQHTIKFVNEQPAGSLVKIESALTRIGGKSAVAMHRMTNTETDLLAATTEIVLVYFDLNKRESIAIPEMLKQRMAPYLVDTETLK